jgi:hypothetical protein
MPATMVEPEVEVPVGPSAKPMYEPAYEPGPASLKQRIRHLLVTIFEGHEEFLGYTPD